MDYLAQRFEEFSRGECAVDAFERGLLAYCRPSPERAWRALALLDQYFRRRRISEKYCRRLRSQIAQHAMRMEGHTVEPEPPPPPEPAPELEPPPAPEVSAPEVSAPEVSAPEALRADELLSSPPPYEPPTRVRTGGRRLLWRRGLQTSPALGLAAVMLGVAASTNMREMPTRPHTEEVPVVSALPIPAAIETPGPEVISLSSDRYLVYPHQRALEFRVERSPDASSDARFVWWTQPSGAKSSEDYIGTRRKLAAVPNGTTSLTLQVPILANPQRRHIEMFYVVIGKADGGADLGAIRRAAVFIMPADAG